MYRSILVPLDGSAFAEHALPLALSIARRAGTGLQLVRVHSLLETSYAPEAALFDQTLDAHLKKDEQAYLEGVVKRLTLISSVPVSSILLEGEEVAVALRAAVVSRGADLVVMTTHGRGPVGRFWLGSVTDQLVRDLPIPLLLVRPTDAAPDVHQEPVLKHLLLPLNGTAFAEQMLESAITLGRLMEADYTLLCAIKPALPAGLDVQAVHTAPPAQSILDRLEATHEEVCKAAQNYLDQVAGRLRAQSLRVYTRVEAADQPALAILQAARPPAIDLVALETHGRRGLARLVLGSTADKVIRGATTPVLVHRPRQPRSSPSSAGTGDERSHTAQQTCDVAQ